MLVISLLFVNTQYADTDNYVKLIKKLKKHIKDSSDIIGVLNILIYPDICIIDNKLS